MRTLQENLGDARNYKREVIVVRAALSLGNNDPAAAPAATIYFTAGPNQGSGGLFGYMTAVSTELTEGNSQ